MALGTVLASVASGTLTPDEATAIAGVIELKRKAIGTCELEVRLRAIEQRLDTPCQEDIFCFRLNELARIRFDGVA
jgi:hypothetical protein